jgi:trimethylguanosine synthase
LGVADRIEFIYGDYVDFARSLASWPRREAIDVVFLSPPWGESVQAPSSDAIGGMDYLNFTTEHEADTNHSSTQQSTYSLGHILPIPGAELFELTLNLTPNIAYYLPRNVDVTELSLLARPLERVEMGENGGREREWVEVEEEWVGEKLKAVTAYFGGLVAEE